MRFENHPVHRKVKGVHKIVFNVCPLSKTLENTRETSVDKTLGNARGKPCKTRGLKRGKRRGANKNKAVMKRKPLPEACLVNSATEELEMSCFGGDV